MPKKNVRKTPRSQVKNALRQLWLRSRERQFAIKRDAYTCQCCGGKQSRAKGKEFFVQVHHKGGVGNWEKLIDEVYKQLLCDPDGLQTLCAGCHDEEHEKGE